ncbi:hypothetical protein GCM10010520_05320 [Rhizobium viscosum]|uniref:Uncharacterized protein n=1 Tax=Rhizobium viscosum TaxID=1673 RepID=A0ABR9ILS9_RHIVS|nr:hypothetical protein [Rhizobium viscosum]MBE1504121.1 hypothetical protein [Rhizobium viscosum]
MAEDIAQYWLDRGARFEATAQPMAVPFTVRVPDQAWPLLGKIVLMWTVLDSKLDQLIWMLSLHHELPANAIGSPGDDAFRTKITFLERAVEEKYAARPNVVKEFARLKSKCLNLKAVRDSIAHGQIFSASQLSDEAVVFKHKNSDKTYSLAELAVIVNDIAQYIGRLNEFHEWANWPTQKQRLLQMQAHFRENP